MSSVEYDRLAPMITLASARQPTALRLAAFPGAFAPQYGSGLLWPYCVRRTLDESLNLRHVLRSQLAGEIRHALLYEGTVEHDLAQVLDQPDPRQAARLQPSA
ncbi:hypothetical protein [Cupriavidus basilensis]|uniref:hypothetical protein n=1 Tax=Cupriavidus basilensis TaxID=68895 RepID=UPI00157B1BDD|nr:hypothetical protein [Cupriavidus basilensis]